MSTWPAPQRNTITLSHSGAGNRRGGAAVLWIHPHAAPVAAQRCWRCSTAVKVWHFLCCAGPWRWKEPPGVIDVGGWVWAVGWMALDVALYGIYHSYTSLLHKSMNISPCTSFHAANQHLRITQHV